MVNVMETEEYYTKHPEATLLSIKNVTEIQIQNKDEEKEFITNRLGVCESCGERRYLTKHHTHVNNKKQMVCFKCHRNWNKYRCWGIIYPFKDVIK